MQKIKEFKGDEVELFVCKYFLEQRPQELPKKSISLFIHLLSDGFKKAIEKDPVKEEDKFFLYKVIEKRVKHVYSYDIKDERLILFLCEISQTPGKAVLYLTMLQYFSKFKGINEFTLNNFIELFPHGFPDDESLKNVWDAQKFQFEDKRRTGSDNMVDHSDAMKTIFP